MVDETVSIDGISVPHFLYGTAWKENETRRLTELALQQGFRGIDTANQRRHYHEAEVGGAVAAALATGLVYTYTVDSSNDWYWTALDFRTGKVVYKSYAGTGIGYNNNYAGISISPSGAEYLGSLSGIVSMRDGG